MPDKSSVQSSESTTDPTINTIKSDVYQVRKEWSRDGVPFATLIEYRGKPTWMKYEVMLLVEHVDGWHRVVNGIGITARDAYQQAYRKLRSIRQWHRRAHPLRVRLDRALRRAAAYRARLYERPTITTPTIDTEDGQTVRDLREGLQEVRRALAGTRLAEGEPLHTRVAAVVERMREAERLLTFEQSRAAQQKRALEHQAAVIVQLLTLLRQSAGQNSPTYARALSMARAIGVSAPQQEETA